MNSAFPRKNLGFPAKADKNGRGIPSRHRQPSDCPTPYPLSRNDLRPNRQKSSKNRLTALAKNTEQVYTHS